LLFNIYRAQQSQGVSFAVVPINNTITSLGYKMLCCIHSDNGG